MAKIKNPFSRFRLVYRRSKPLTKMVVVAAIVLSMAALISLGEAKDAQLGTLESIQKIAREVLDLVLPGTVFFGTGD